MIELVVRRKMKRILEVVSGRDDEREGKRAKITNGCVATIGRSKGETYHNESLKYLVEKEGDGESTVEPIVLDDKFVKKNIVQDLANTALSEVVMNTCS